MKAWRPEVPVRRSTRSFNGCARLGALDAIHRDLDPRAETQLMDLWSDFPFDRSGMTKASEEINQLLRDDPLAKGRPFGVCRILSKPPIVALHSVDEGDRKAEVLMVKRL